MRAFSKINLILDVIKKRPDGYHELQSVMQTLALHDTLTIAIERGSLTDNRNGLNQKDQQLNVNPSNASDNSSNRDVDFNLLCSDPCLPTDDSNLVTQAAKFMIKKYNITQPVRIYLKKRIPQAAGLAGGSSDCAATLIGLNKLFNLNIPLHSQCAINLISIGERFGADVPFCLLGGTALAEGIGERLTPLAFHPHCWVVLACPSIHVSTADVFREWEPTKATPRNVQAISKALSQGDLKKIADGFRNDLTQITTKKYPIINELISEMKSLGALNAAMSGSGPTVFGYFDHKKTAEKAQKHMKSITGRAFLTEIIS